jgi:hypothetical protein
MHPDTKDRRVYECLGVNDCGATVRATKSDVTEFTTHTVEAVAFEAPGRAFRIARNPLGIEVL